MENKKVNLLAIIQGKVIKKQKKEIGRNQQNYRVKRIRH